MTAARTRIAPSPTGQDLHIGNAYTALINYVVSLQTKGKFILRIEDTDQSRKVDGSEESIMRSLAWLGLVPDESPQMGGPHAPYRQSERLDTYKEHALKLVNEGNAYYCFCTSERLAEVRKRMQKEKKPPMYDGKCRDEDQQVAIKRAQDGESFVIRLKVPRSGTSSFTDIIRGEISFENKLIDDQVILKSDGYPTYHLGVVVDDHAMGITHIIRGEEWISSTPKHVHLYSFFGWDMPQFAHMPLLRNPDKSKLSKRKNPVWVTDYKDKGILPEALINYLGTLAWAHPEEKDIFTLEEMTEVFDLADIQTTAPSFDVKKLEWVNKQYLMHKPLDEYKKLIKDVSVFASDSRFDALVEKTAELVQPRIGTIYEFDTMAGFYFNSIDTADFEKPVQKSHVQTCITALESVTASWTHDEMEASIREEAERQGQKARAVFMDLRIAITGKTVGPPLLESLEILGVEETMSRLTAALG